MNKREYAENVAARATEMSGYEFKVAEVNKNGAVLIGITLTEGFETDNGSRISPNFYIDNAYNAGSPVEVAAEELIHVVKEERLNAVNISAASQFANDIASFETIKGRLFPVMCSKTRKEYLKKMANVSINGELAETFIVKDGEMSVRVTKDILTMWGVTETEVAETAEANLKALGDKPITMNEMMRRMGVILPFFGGPELYVFTTSDSLYGASQMLNFEAIDELADKTGYDKFYVIPSSVHEILLAPVGIAPVEELQRMIPEVNETQVDLVDQLSDKLFMYKKGSRKITTVRKAA